MKTFKPFLFFLREGGRKYSCPEFFHLEFQWKKRLVILRGSASFVSRIFVPKTKSPERRPPPNFKLTKHRLFLFYFLPLFLMMHSIQSPFVFSLLHNFNRFHSLLVRCSDSSIFCIIYSQPLTRGAKRFAAVFPG